MVTMTDADIRRGTVLEILARARREGRIVLDAQEGKRVCDAYGIPTPHQNLATSVDEALTTAARIGFPVALKIVSPDVLHKSDAGGVRVGLASANAIRQAYGEIVASVRARHPQAQIDGMQVQQMVAGGQEVIVGAVTDPSFGKMVAFGLGGILVEVLKDVTFRLAPVTAADAESMLDSIRGAEVLRGVRGSAPVDRARLADVIRRVSEVAAENPEISEIDLNPVFADARGAIAADVRILLDFDQRAPRPSFRRDEILEVMNKIMKPRAIAVIGASTEAGKIGNSMMRNLINGGFAGEIHPVNPKADEIMGRKAYRSVADIPGDVDVAIFAIPAPLVADEVEACGKKGIRAAILIPSGFAETGNVELQDHVVDVARRSGVRLMGPNIYGYYYTPSRLCATFCTPYDFAGPVALSS